MGKKMRNAPVYFTIVQVRFNAILALDKFVPAIQDSLRKEYPVFQKIVQTQLNLNVPEQQGSQIDVPAERRLQYSFGNMERNSAFLLDDHSLSFQTTEYDVFSQFLDQFMVALQTVNEQVGGLSYTDRIGLRYLDHVRPLDNEKISQYIHGSMLGMIERSDGRIIHSFYETLVQHQVIKIMTRVVVQAGGLAFPPDLQPASLKINERFIKNRTGLFATIDTDGYTEEGGSPFSLERVKDQLNAVHDKIIEAFRATVTDHAVSVWS